MSNQNVMKSIEEIYNLRTNFLIVGLTGFTGNGCSTVASLLQTKQFEDMQLPVPSLKEEDGNRNSDRKDEIIYKYASVNWNPFTVVRAVDVLSSFLLELCEEDFKSMINEPERLEDIGYSSYSVTNKIFIDCLLEHNTENVGAAITHLETKLPEFRNKLKGILEPEKFTKIYQTIGNNVRKTGNAKGEIDLDDSESIFSISKRINHIIKLYRKTEGETRIVIDALRNPYELKYLQERYSAFYLWAIHASNADRKDRLEDTQRNAKQINDLYKSESESKTGFLNQNIPECYQQADIHLVNENNDYQKVKLKKQIIRTLALIERPGIIQPTTDERLMQMANIAKLNSGCISRQVGAIVVDKDNQVVGVGWNSSPAGQTCCILRSITNLLNGKDQYSYSTYEKENVEFQDKIKDISIEESKLNGRNNAYCFKSVYNEIEGDKNQVHTRSLHAEENAFLQTSKFGGIGVREGTLYTTASPCELCAKKSYHLGIKRIVYIDKYPGISIEHILSNGTQNVSLESFKGVTGLAFQKLFMPFLSLKDELEYISRS